jgi:hypothetical protein
MLANVLSNRGGLVLTAVSALYLGWAKVGESDSLTELNNPLHSQKPWASGKHAKLPPGQYNTSIS